MIRLSKSSISIKEKLAVAAVLDREYLGMGKDVKDFEKALTKFFGRPSVCVANGTSALQLALHAVGVKFGDEVIVPSFTYVASFQAISALGAVPISCDILESTLTLDPIDVEKKISPKTKVILPVHYAGGVGQILAIYSIAKKYNLRVIEDAAHAFGTTLDGKRVGSFGDIACFSFDGIKNITSGEGGCIVTDDRTVLSRVMDARLLGVEKDTEKRFLGERSWEFDVKDQGWRFHMSNIMAAIGLVQLDRFSEFASKRQCLASHYNRLLSINSKIKLLDSNYDDVVPHIYPVRLLGKVSRKKVIAMLEDLGIQTGIHYQPNHLLSFYKGSKNSLPVTEKIYPQIFSLPLHVDLKMEDVEFVCQQLLKILDNP